MNEYTESQIMDLLLNKPKYLKPLEYICKYEQQHKEEWNNKEYTCGWSYNDVPLNGGQLAHLNNQEIIEKIYDSNSTSLYRINSLPTVTQTIKKYKQQQKQIRQQKGRYKKNIYKTANTTTNITEDGSQYHITQQTDNQTTKTITIPANKLQKLVQASIQTQRYEKQKRMRQSTIQGQ